MICGETSLSRAIRLFFNSLIGGKDKTGAAPLENDSEIIIGTSESPYRFTVKYLERLRNGNAGKR